MQTIWSRVAQVRGACRCPQCAPSVSGVSRRATGSATRRIPRYLTSSTLWYSGVFAVAATFDAGFKQQRREKWDKAIADVKQELAQPAVVRQEQRDEFDLRVEDGLEEEGAIQFRPFGEEDERDELQYTDGWTKAEWPANTGAPLHTRNLPLTSIYAENWQRVNAEMYRWSPKKLAMVQTSVDILLLELIAELQIRDESSPAADSVPLEFKPTLFQESEDLHKRIYDKHQHLRVLRRADFEMTHYTLPEAPEEELPIPEDTSSLCNYKQDEENRFRSTQRELNSSLQHLFKLHSEEQITKPSMLGRILYILGCSSASPNTNTFNTLLLGFSRAEEPLLFSNVLRTFRRCHMRPDEITLATTLNHFTKVEDPQGFAHWIELIRGGRNGLALARPDVHIADDAKTRLIHHPEHPERIIQLPYHTPIVFGSIIAGVLKFTGFEAALQICQSMGQEGWGLCMAGLTPLLHDCVQRRDWNSGMAVWNQIRELKAKSRRKTDSRWLSERIRLDTFATMLKLCLRCDRRDVFNEVWDMALKSHRGATDKLRSLVKGAGKRSGVDLSEESVANAIEREKRREHHFERQATLRREKQMASALNERQTNTQIEEQTASIDESQTDLRTEEQAASAIQPETSIPMEGPSNMERASHEDMSYFKFSELDDPISDHFEEPLLSTTSAAQNPTEDLDQLSGPWQIFDYSSRDAVVGGVAGAMGQRLVLRNDDVLEDMSLEGTFPRYQSTLHFGERGVSRIRLAETKKEAESWSFSSMSQLREEEEELRDREFPDLRPDTFPTEKCLSLQRDAVRAQKKTSGPPKHEASTLSREGETTYPDDREIVRKAKKAGLHSPHQMSQEELLGLMPASHELDEYEMTERPMTLRA